MDGRQGFVAALAWALLLLSTTTTTTTAAQAASPVALEKFRAAAALQQRGLFDLAAADYQALEQELTGDPLATRACLARGVCLFQLGQYAEVRATLAPLREHVADFSAAEHEQFLATLGLACYNLALTSTGAAAHESLEAAAETLAAQLEQFPTGSLAPQAAFYRAEALYARGRHDESAIAYRRTLDQWPQLPQRAEALYGLVTSLDACRDVAATIAACQQFERECAEHAALDDVRLRHANALVASAEVARQAGRNDDARRFADTLLQEFPESACVPAALLVIAQLQIAESDLAAAESSLDRCRERSTRPQIMQDATLLRARVRLERGNHAGSLADAKAVLAREPQRTEVLQLAGLAALGLKEFDSAIDLFSRLLAADANYAAADRVLYDLAWAYEQNGQPQEAVRTYERLIAAHPDSPLVAECHFRLGQSEFAAKKYIAAATHFRNAEKNTNDAALREKALHQLAWCSYEAGDHGAARQAFETQRHDYPAGPLAGDAAALAGECCYQQNQFAAAIDHFARAVANEHTAAELRALALVHASQAAGELGEWKHSLAFADRAIQECPHDPRLDDACYARGIALLEMGFFDDAQRELTRIADQQSGLLSIKAGFALGRILAAQHQGDAAVRQFFKVAYGHGGKNAPESYHATQAEAIFAAAEVLAASDRPGAARKLYEELVTTYPNSDRAALARKSLDQPMRR